MDLRGAYVVLEVAPGATEEAVRDARKTLAKVWHPDRHAGDPALQKRAEQKLADVNSAYELVRAAGFPSTLPGEPRKAATEPGPPQILEPPPAQHSTLEIVPRRRVRWSVVIVLAAALAGGAYLAVTQLGQSSSPSAAERVAVGAPTLDAGAAITAHDAVAYVAPTIDAAPASATATFGLGATHEEVLAAQGQPTSRTNVVNEEWAWGFSYVTFDERGRVVGWWDRDNVLKVKLVPSNAAVATRATETGNYGIGATKDEIIAVQGTPNRISTVVDETWYYGTGSSVTFNEAGTLTGYRNSDHVLHLDVDDQR